MSWLVAALRRLGVDLRVEEAGIAFSLFFFSFLMGTFQFAGKVVRQATFIDTWGAERLPYVYLLVALVAIPVLPLYGLLAERVPRAMAVVVTNLAIVAGLVLFAWLFGAGGRWVAIAYYVWMALASVLLLSQFWSYTNMRLDPRQARRLFGFIGAGALLGGVAGGQLARLVGSASPTITLLSAAAPLVLTILLVPFIDRRAAGRSQSMTGSMLRARSEQPSISGWQAVRSSSHLRLIAIMMSITAIVAQIVDLQFNWMVQQTTDSFSERNDTFGTLFSVMGLAAFFFQLVFTARIHRRLGVGFAMRVLPTFVGLLSLAVVFSGLMPALALFVVVASLKIGDNGLRYSLDHATRELLFVPVPARERVGAKAYVDVLVHRFAKGLAAILLLTVTFDWLSPYHMSILSVALCVVLVACTFRVQRHYVEALRNGLLGGSDADEDQVDRIDLGDVTTLEILVESLGSSDGGRVVQSIDLLAAHDRHNLVSPLLLHHHDPAVRKRSLEVLAESGRTDAIPLIEMRLGDEEPEVRAEAVRAFASLSGRAGPQLMRSRLRDPDPRVRSSAIHCLLQQGDAEARAEARATLDELMADEDPRVRSEAASAVAGLGEAQMHHLLIQLLYDQDFEVTKSAIDAVRRQAEEDGANPLFVPILISLLRDRRLKHDARQALVSLGDGVIPALVHFMNDPGEQIWVRRALPKTIAAFDSIAAYDALFEGLEGSFDLLLRSKIVEALTHAPSSYAGSRRVSRAIEDECLRYCQCLVRLVGLSAPGDYRLLGARLEWRAGVRTTLLQRLLDEQRLGHLRNCFRLLAIGQEGTDLRIARERLLDLDRKGRARALEYLDNVLDGAHRQKVLTLIDDQPLEERLESIERLFGLRPQGARDTLTDLLVADPIPDESGRWLVAAAVQSVLQQSIKTLFPRVRELAERAADDLVRETAEWATEAI